MRKRANKRLGTLFVDIADFAIALYYCIETPNWENDYQCMYSHHNVLKPDNLKLLYPGRKEYIELRRIIITVSVQYFEFRCVHPFFAMSTACSRRFEAVLLCSHPKGPNMSVM